MMGVLGALFWLRQKEWLQLSFAYKDKIHNPPTKMSVVDSPSFHLNLFPENVSDELSVLNSPAFNSWVVLPGTELTTDYTSPVPNLSFSPYDKTLKTERQQLHYLMEELVVSEENYVTNLKVLGNYYLDTFKIRQLCRPYPIVELQATVKSLIDSHSMLAKHLRNCFSSTSGNGEERLVKMSHMVCSYGIETAWYSKYIELFHYIRDLLEANPLWFRSWESYLRLIQHKRSDLSFMSLMQKPLARIARYKLYIEAFICHTTKKREDLKRAYERCLKLLQIVNEISISSEEYSKARMLNNICDFLSISRSIKVCLQFFGTCLFADSSQVIWKSQKKFINRVYGVFLYKHHLVLSEVGHMWSRKMKVRFVIPLKGSKFYPSPVDTSGGIFSKYEFSSKLDFTDKERRYEILFVAANCWEHATWCQHFTTQDHEDGSSSMFKVPPQITPVDVTTKLLAEEDRTNCYFNELIIVDNCKNRKNVETDVQYWFLLLPTKDVDYFIRKEEKGNSRTKNHQS